ANNLNLSVMAISKALRDAPDIGEATKERVRQEADRLGYIPNHNARSLREGRSRMVGVIVQEINEPFAAGVICGIEDAASDEDIQVLVAASHLSEDLEMKMLHRMFERKVEIVFIQAQVRFQHRTPVLEAARKYGIPLVFLDHYPADARQFQSVSWVVADCFKAGQLAASHLADLGHRDILYFSGPPTASSTADHLSGFKKGLIEAGIEYDDEKVFLSGLSIDGGVETMTRALNESLNFTAVVCAHDATAVGANEVLNINGMQVPDDISVVGFGDGILAAHGPVPMTTVERPKVELGSVALRHWMSNREQMQAGARVQPRILPVELVVRKSTQKL
ncbi:MAG: LacI family DNA-binding transcriptional regulator, partial [Verrucomicrobiota bacterium]